MNYIESRISNGVLDGINSTVQSLKTSARLPKYFELYDNDLSEMWRPSLHVTHLK